MDNIHFENQRKYCHSSNLPLFAMSHCNHMYGWDRCKNFGKLQSLTEILIEKYGEQEAFRIASSTHILSCPICLRSWTD